MWGKSSPPDQFCSPSEISVPDKGEHKRNEGSGGCSSSEII